MSDHAAGQQEGGTLVRGADGELYFIPDSRLDAFRVPEKEAEPIKRVLGAGPLVNLSVLRGPDAKRTGLVAGEETTVSTVSVAAIRQRNRP